MGFRKRWNAHDRWTALVQDNADLLSDVPRTALIRENAFRDYVTQGAHRGTRFTPSVFDLPPEALAKLWTFINHRAQFDMDASLFDDFNDAFRRSRDPNQNPTPQPAATLPDEVANLWTEYLRAEQDHVRADVMERLARFIDRLLHGETHVWHAWALDTAASVSDDGADLLVRFPLFERVLLPALADGVTRGVRGCARWLAHFDQLLHQAELSVVPQHLRTAEGLLQEAVRLDPADHLARRRLVERRRSYLEHTLHELPSGVLYGDNGATLSECDELLQLLAEFRGHVEVLGVMDRYRALIDDCAEHYDAYRDYLRRDRPGGSYERFREHGRSGA